MMTKFRAWDEVLKVMYDWENLIMEKDDSQNYWSLGYRENIAVTKYDHNQILMQSIGIEDKKGVEIYEGDIIKATYHTVNGKGTEIEIVKVLGSVYFNYGAYYVDGYYFKELNDLEVIGNIYENKELLKEVAE